MQQWSSSRMFILAASGSAVGLGNIWRFPYLAGENGGGLFVLTYILFVFGIGLPILMAEILLGRAGQKNPADTMRHIAKEQGFSQNWGYLGWIGMLCGFLILSYYSVICGWILAYIIKVFSGALAGIDTEIARQSFNSLMASPEKLLVWHTIFILLTAIVIGRGIRSGLEAAVKWMMPGLFILIIILLAYVINTPGFIEGLKYLFFPHHSFDYQALIGVILAALGQALFSLSIGVGAIMTYAAYLPKHTSVFKVALGIATADTLTALLAGVIIFSIVFSYQLAPEQGPGLIFMSLPVAFDQMPFGTIAASLFFILLLFAGWSSAISLLEPMVSWLIERGFSRVKATVLLGFLAWLLGIATVLSFNKWAFSFEFLGKIKQNGFFDMLDILTANFMLPLGGLFIAIFVGWFMSHSSLKTELAVGHNRAYKIWHSILCCIAPLAIVAIFFNAIGLL